jgi:hypothetical protein
MFAVSTSPEGGGRLVLSVSLMMIAGEFSTVMSGGAACANADVALASAANDDAAKSAARDAREQLTFTSPSPLFRGQRILPPNQQLSAAIGFAKRKI